MNVSPRAARLFTFVLQNENVKMSLSLLVSFAKGSLESAASL